MASTSTENIQENQDQNGDGDSSYNFESEIPVEKVLVQTDDVKVLVEDAFLTEASSSNDLNNLTIVQDGISNEEFQLNIDVSQRSISELSLASNDQSASIEEEDLSNNKEWRDRDKHVLILSSAGKPIYSRYGAEDKLVTLFGVIQALISFVEKDGQDVIKSIHAQGRLIVFLIKGPIILVCISRTKESVAQISTQLNYVYNQIISVLTLEQLTRIYEQRRNYDLRRVLSGAERLIDHLLDDLDNEPALLLGAVQCLPLAATTRDAITNTIINSCNKIKKLVFAILIGKNQLITMVHMKKVFLHPADLHLIFNLVNSSESFKTAESWAPICLPKFNSKGFLHAHVSYLADDCQACLLLLSVDRDSFFPLSVAKQKIVEKLRRASLLQSINEALSDQGVVEMYQYEGWSGVRHFVYKCKATAQFFWPKPKRPFHFPQMKRQLMEQYRVLHHRLHSPSQPLKLLYVQDTVHTMLGWITTDFELYLAFEPLTTKQQAIYQVNKILKWLKKDEHGLFISNVATF